MAKDKKTIVIYSDWIATFEQLNDDEAGKLIKHLLRYVNDKNPTADRLTELLFSQFKNQLKRDLVKWEETKQQRSIAGKKGAEKRWQNMANDSKPKQGIAKIAVNDNVNVNVINNKKINTDIWGNEIDEQGKPVKGKSKNFK